MGTSIHFFLIFWPKKKYGTHFSKNQDPFFKMGTKKKWVLMLERLKIRYKIYNIFLLCFKNEFLVETDKENYFLKLQQLQKLPTTSKTSNNFKNLYRCALRSPDRPSRPSCERGLHAHHWGGLCCKKFKNFLKFQNVRNKINLVCLLTKKLKLTFRYAVLLMDFSCETDSLNLQKN